ncbi:MAG: hypothetical protein EBU31_07550 [Proteobacteria bacterium]|nr:hypothetical protein [Pseudomonadota bacterium]
MRSAGSAAAICAGIWPMPSAGTTVSPRAKVEKMKRNWLSSVWSERSRKTPPKKLRRKPSRVAGVMSMRSNMSSVLPEAGPG